MKVDDGVIFDAIEQFLEIDAGTTKSFNKTEIGVNNFVYYVNVNDGNYVLRIYNNGNNLYKVQFEHEILSKLQAKNLSFQIPLPLSTKITNEPYAVLSNGSFASLFHRIPGSCPLLNWAYEVGKASGELNLALSTIQITLKSPTPPYYELYNVHPNITREIFLHTVSSDLFHEYTDSISYLLDIIYKIEMILPIYHTMDLPQQFIHGDLNYDNILFSQELNHVTGIVDFEFVAVDWRAMELATCLSKYAKESNPMPYFTSFIEGYAIYGQLNIDEIQIIPTLIILRIISNFIYFIGRFLSEEDKLETLTSRLQNYCERIIWIEAHSSDIVDMANKAIYGFEKR
eukprot:gene2919-5733_t